jgi:hypothetical protein
MGFALRPRGSHAGVQCGGLRLRWRRLSRDEGADSNTGQQQQLLLDVTSAAGCPLTRALSFRFLRLLSSPAPLAPYLNQLGSTALHITQTCGRAPKHPYTRTHAPTRSRTPCHPSLGPTCDRSRPFPPAHVGGAAPAAASRSPAARVARLALVASKSPGCPHCRIARVVATRAGSPTACATRLATTRRVSSTVATAL